MISVIYDYLIVGAGITGAVLAHELTKRNKKVLVVDKRSHIGGNCYTEVNSEILIHKYGAHIFHTNKKWIWDYITSFGEFIPYVHEVKAKYKDELYDLPFNLNTYSQVYKDSIENSLQKFKEETALYKSLQPTNLEEQALKLVGKTVYETLIKGYTEKQWGKSCKDLPPEIIKRLPFRENTNNNYFDDEFQGLPKRGYTEIINNLLKGIEVRLGYNYTKDNTEIKAVKIIHTGMIDEYYNYCLGQLEYRSLIFNQKWLPCVQVQKYPVVNYTDKEIPFTRIIEHKHFDKISCRWTVITEEYPDHYKPGKEAYYPINSDKNTKLYLEYKQLAEQDNIIFCGRLGGYKYLDMNDAIEEALMLVKNLLN